MTAAAGRGGALRGGGRGGHGFEGVSGLRRKRRRNENEEGKVFSSLILFDGKRRLTRQNALAFFLSSSASLPFPLFAVPPTACPQLYPKHRER